MPEYLAPGIYVEETSFAAQPIISGETATTAFLGVAPDFESGAPFPLFTSLRSLEEACPGADERLVQAAAAFFDNGGKRLYVIPAATGDWNAALDAALPQLEVQLIAAPGIPEAAKALIAHAEARSLFAIVDPPASLDLAGIQVFRAGFDTSHAALYYPWVATPAGLQPPSGFIAGIYAKNDISRGVWKAPANAAVVGAIGLEAAIEQKEQDILNPLGINCIVKFPDRGILIWGARTMSKDVEWQYVNVRRLMLYLEHSIDNGIAWAVFEPNAEALWAQVRRVVSDFLMSLWQNGILLGEKPEHGFFVACDRTTMTQADIDAGRLIVEIGIAPIRPAEFVVVRITQCTAQ